jgi:hypothetical protein
MSKLLLSVLALAFLVVPAVHAQQQAAYTVTVEIQDLPATMSSNGTQMTIPFKVKATVSGASPCLAAVNSGSTFTIALSAEITNVTNSPGGAGDSSTAHVNPVQHTIASPVLIPATGGGAERTADATLVIGSGPYTGEFLNVTVEVTATFAGSNGGCTGVPAAAPSSDSASIVGHFEPVPDEYGGVTDNGQKMPGVGLGLTLVALAALAFVARRK